MNDELSMQMHRRGGGNCAVEGLEVELSFYAVKK